MLTGGSHFVRGNVASYLIFVFPWLRLGLCSSSEGHYSISRSFIPCVYCDCFSTIPISVYAFSLFISGFVLTSQPFFFASSPFSCGEPRAFLCYSVFCYARARQEFAFEFHLRNFHLFSGS